MMFKKNDTVFYPTYGVCRVSEISEKSIGGNKIECYLVKPVFDEHCSVLIPTNNRSATDRMQPVLSRSEMNELIRTIPGQRTIWIDNVSARKKKYDEIVEQGNRIDLVQLVKTLHLRRESLQKSGKKLHSVDDKYLQIAEKMLHDEISFVLDIDREKVLPFIMEKYKESKEPPVKKAEFLDRGTAGGNRRSCMKSAPG